MPTSPASKTWQRPSGKIKLKVKKRNGSLGLSSAKNFDVLKPLSPNVQQNGRLASKRKNPFGCSPRKKRTFETNCDYKEAENQLFRALDGQREESKEKENEYFDISDVELQNNKVSSETKVEKTKGTEVEEDEEKPSNPQGQKMFPVDWSLKTKVRFTSPASFSWSNSLKSFELAEGISGFVRCESENIIEENVNTDDSSADFYRTLLHKDCKSWIHPSLPWLQLFPRNNQKKHPEKGNFANIFLDPDLSNSLHQDWVTGFHSVFNLLRCGRCPYFYLCTNHCSMVFVAAGVANNQEMKVLVSPTTKGFRNALTKEGIEFTLPHGQNEESNMSGSDSEADDDDQDKKAAAHESGDEEDWLQSMGINKEHFVSFESHKNTIQVAKTRNTDQHPNSTVVVQGSETQALYNFILNWRSITPKNGQLAGVPPTLISPVAFEGATLRSHKVNQGIVRHQRTKEMKQLFSLEVTGPILPGCLHNICKLLHTTQKGEFTATMVQYQPTVAFNIPSVEDEECLPIAHNKYGLSQSQAKYLSQSQKELQKNCLKELVCKDGLYTWKISGSLNQQGK